MSKIIRLRSNGNVSTTGQLIENSSSFSYRNNGDIYCNELKETGEKTRILNNKDIHVSGGFIEGAVLGETDTQLVNSSLDDPDWMGWWWYAFDPTSGHNIGPSIDWVSHGIRSFKISVGAGTHTPPNPMQIGTIGIKYLDTTLNLTNVYKILFDMKIEKVSLNSYMFLSINGEEIWTKNETGVFLDNEVVVDKFTTNCDLRFGIRIATVPSGASEKSATIYLDNIRLLYY